MYVALLVLKNALRHKLRTILTIIGIVVAITAFGLLRTIVDAWYAGANASSSARLITRNAVSLVFSMPLTYAQKIRQVPGVASVALANWFGGVYISERNFFPQFAISAPSYLEMYPEYMLSPEEKKAFLTDRTGAIAGSKLAETLTETEKAFQLGFVAMTEAILLAIQAVSFVVIVIIMAVMANTMAMTARERYGEYATLKALGFGNGFVALMIFGESLAIALVGGAAGIALTFPLARGFADAMGSLFPIFFVSEDT